MKKRGVVFSSSEYSDDDMLEVIPKVKTANNKNNLQSDDSNSYYYEDYSSFSDKKIVVKQTKPISRQPINRNINNPMPINKTVINNRNQNLNQNKGDSNGAAINTQKSTGSLNHRGFNRPRPLIRSIRSPPQNQSQIKKDSPQIQSSKSSPSVKYIPKEESEIEYDNDSSDNQSKTRSSQDGTNKETRPKIHGSPREMKARQVNQANNTENDDAVIMTPIENDDFTPINVNLKPSKQVSKNTPFREIPDSVTYSIKRTPKRSVHGKSYIFSLIRGGNPVLYSKSSSRHPKGVMPITTSSDVHIKNSSLAEYTLTAEDNCTKFTIRSQQNKIFTYTITPSQNEYSKLPHLNISIDDSFDFTPKEMTSKRPQMNKRGFWFLDFHNKFTLPSEKNSIFIPADPKLGKSDLFVVRKIEKDRIEIDANTTPSDIIIFGIGLSSFLAKYC